MNKTNRILKDLAEIEQAILAAPPGEAQPHAFFNHPFLDDALGQIQRAGYDLSRSLFPNEEDRRRRLFILAYLALLRQHPADLTRADVGAIGRLASQLQAATPATSEPAPQNSTSRHHPLPGTNSDRSRESI